MAESAKYAQLEEFGFGPNVMKRTRICVSCGRASSTGNKRCLSCGKLLSRSTLYDYYKQMHVCCPVCDTVLTASANYCPHCGTQVINKVTKNLSMD